MTVCECPHCYMRVIYKPDGTCPSCHRNSNDRAGANPSLTTLIIRDTDKTPGLCITCGVPTDRKVAVEKSRNDDRESSLILSLLGLMSALLVGLGFIKTGHHGEWVSLSVPVCEGCRRAPQPRHMSFELSSMTFVVHRRFKEEFERENWPPDGR